MAKRELVEKILNLYSKLGGNMNNVLGSRSNITFLGTGKNPEPFVDMSINIEAVGALGKSRILKELESPMGYLTANKLNDVQAGKLYENMLKLDNFYNPKVVANITDMATRTGELTPKGLAALRRKGVYDITTDKQVYYDDIPPTVQTQDPNFIPIRADQYRDIFGKSPGLKNVDLPPPGSRGGADDIAAPIQDAETTIRNLEKQDPKLAEQFKNVMISNKGTLPAKRGSAREFLVEALKEDDLIKTNLNSVISAEDVKYITEGGGGIAGDPLILVEKYFGPRILEALPTGATGEEITIFTRRVMNNVEDAAGNKPDNPRFDRFTARFVDEMAEGGRAGYRLGKSVFKGIADLYKTGKQKTFDFIDEQARIKKPSESFTSQNITQDLIEGPITLDKMKNVDPESLRIIRNTYEQGLYDDMPEIIKAGNLLERFTKVVGGKRVIDYERAEAILGTRLRGDETLDELFAIEFRTRPKAAKGGLAKILEV